MDFTKEDIEEFQRLWKEEFGEELSGGEARYHAARLLTLCVLLAKRPPEKAPSSAAARSSPKAN